MKYYIRLITGSMTLMVIVPLALIFGGALVVLTMFLLPLVYMVFRRRIKRFEQELAQRDIIMEGTLIDISATQVDETTRQDSVRKDILLPPPT